MKRQREQESLPKTLPVARRREVAQEAAKARGLLERASASVLASAEWSAELRRLRGMFLTAIGAEEYQIEASSCAAIGIAKEQKSVSLEKRAEATYAEYHRQKASGSGGHGFRLPLW
jgi:hypothetical protein